MEKHRAAGFVVTGLLLLCGTTAASSTGHYGECPKGWLKHGSSCYKLSSTKSTFDAALDACISQDATLAIIRDSKENTFLKDVVEDMNTWIGIRRSGYGWSAVDEYNYIRYDNWNRMFYDSDFLRENPCATMRKWGSWEPKPCNSRLPSLCEQPGSCADGWYGENCNIECHCYLGDACHRKSGLCPRGCSKGWTGTLCREEIPSTLATYHCMRTADGSLRALVTVDHKDKKFPVVRAVGQDAQPLACPEDRMTVDRLTADVLYVTLFLPGAFDEGNDTANATTLDGVNDNDNVTTDDADDVSNATSAGFAEAAGRDKCIADWTDNGTVTWLIEFRRYENLTIGDDVTVEVTCDLSDAISLVNEASFADDSDVDRPLSPEMSPAKISVVLIDVPSGQAINRFHLGQTVQLQVKVDVGSWGIYECPYPHSCVARTSDAGADDEGVMLVDDKGCPAAGSPITSFQVTSDAILSNPFPAFTLGGDSVVIECETDIVKKETFQECPAPDCPPTNS